MFWLKYSYPPPTHTLIVKCLFKVFSQSSHKFTLFTLKDILRPGPRYWKKINTAFIKREFSNLVKDKVIMQGQFFQRCTHLLYCSLLSLGGNVNTRQDVTTWHGIHLSHKKSMKYSGHRKLLCEISKISKLNAFNLLGY